MKNRKVLSWLFSLVLILGVALPCTFATAGDMEETGSVFSDDTAEEEVGQDQEIPVEEIEHNDEVPETDKPALYARIMACTTLEEISIVLEEATDEEFASLTDEENMEIGARIKSFEPDPLPPVVITKFDDEPVASEIIYPTVSFTRVAPFGTPVTGGANEGGRR